jgi:hypothetical protein
VSRRSWIRRAVLPMTLAALAASLPAASASAANQIRYDRNSITNGLLALTQAGWRAGSGVVQDACQPGRGWIPTGNYDLWGHWDHYDSTIKGRVFYLSNHTCQYGQLRTELFIHTEETASTGQSCPTSGDDPYCWEGDFDYQSNGCIKVKQPNKDMYEFHQWFHQKVTGSHGSFNINNGLWVNGV